MRDRFLDMLNGMLGWFRSRWPLRPLCRALAARREARLRSIIEAGPLGAYLTPPTLVDGGCTVNGGFPRSPGAR